MPLEEAVRRAIERRAAGRGATKRSVATFRTNMEAGTEELGGPPAPVAAVTQRVARGTRGDGVPLRVYQPLGSGGKPAPVVVFFHGGGWVGGSVDTHDRVIRTLAGAAGAVVVGVSFRLAPEHPYPAGLDDARTATSWVAAHAEELGGDPHRLVVFGDSAGGNLAAVVARYARDGDIPPVALQVLAYPALDPAMDTPSYREFADGPVLTAADSAWYWDLYLEGRALRTPDTCPPSLPDLTGLPAAFIATAEHDPLRDEGERYADRLRAAGVDVRGGRYAGMTHDFLRWQAVTPTAAQALADVGAAIRALPA